MEPLCEFWNYHISSNSLTVDVRLNWNKLFVNVAGLIDSGAVGSFIAEHLV